MTSSATYTAGKPEWFNSKHRTQSHQARPKTNTMHSSNNILVVNGPIFGSDALACDTVISRSLHKSARVDTVKSTLHRRKIHEKCVRSR